MTETRDRLDAALGDRYRIERMLGEGGMARVWLADDIKHGRQVAIKVLKPELAAIIGAERFLSEIRTTANLQHPHILALYDSGEADSFLYYVMPFIEGESLRDRLDREKQLAVDDAIELTRSILSALDYAHRHDVIHRDIKPANILLHDGNALVSDFGIALAVTGASGDRMTETGLSLGTPHYMAPEQATADRDLTSRADIYSVACLLYEMLVGAPPHTGPSAQSVLVSILTEDPKPVTQVRRSVPDHVGAALDRALEKLPADRFSTAGEFASALVDESFTWTGGPTRVTAATRAAGTAPAPVRSTSGGWWSQTQSKVAVGVAAVALIFAMVGTLGGGGSDSAPGTSGDVTTRMTLDFEDQIEPFGYVETSPDGSAWVFTYELEPDGEHLHAIAVRYASDPEVLRLPDTEDGSSPTFTPDGQAVVFVSEGRTLQRVPVTGGRPFPISIRFPGEWGEIDNLHVGADEWVYFDFHGGLARAPLNGGDAEVLLDAGDRPHQYGTPRPVAGTDFVLFTWVGQSEDEGREVRILDVGDGTQRTLAPGVDPRFHAPDLLVFASPAQAIFAARFDPKAGELAGTPIPVLDSIGVRRVRAEFTLSNNGTAVYWLGAYAEAEEQGDQLVEVDSLGNERRLGITPGYFRTPRYSPDGSRVASQAAEGVWIYDLGTGAREQIEEEFASNALWSPDGERIAYVRNGNETVVRDAFSGSEVTIIPGTTPFAWTPDGSEVVGLGPGGIVRTPVREGSSQIPFLARNFRDGAPDISPDGRWIAYETNAPGETVVMVRSFPESSPPIRVSLGEGVGARWSGDGSRLMYRAGPDRDSVTVVEVVPDGDGVRIENRRTWFVPDFGWRYLSHELHPDGDRVLVVRRSDTAIQEHVLTVAVNWLAEARRRLAEAGGS